MIRNIAGKMKSTVGKSILIGAFMARSLGGRLTAQSRVGGLDAQDPAQRRAELIGLDDRAGERRELRRVDALGHPLERVRPALADPHFAEVRPNSSARGPSMCSVSFAIAPSKPRPASTLTASRSSASGRSARIFSRRPFAFSETK